MILSGDERRRLRRKIPMSSSKAMTPPTAIPAIAPVDNEEEAPFGSGELVAPALVVAPLEVEEAVVLVVLLLIVVEAQWVNVLLANVCWFFCITSRVDMLKMRSDSVWLNQDAATKRLTRTCI